MMEKIDLNQSNQENLVVEEPSMTVATDAITPAVQPHLGRERQMFKKTNDKWLYAIPVAILALAFLAGNFIFQKKEVAVEPEPEVIAETNETSLLAIDSSMPKTEACPLNGAMYTQVEKDSWSQRRPLAVMIENTPEARPQSGLTNADIVFELVAEGGITRFMAMYYCDAQKEEVTLAPIRSARTYYIDLASGFNLPMYVHVGGANVAGPTNALGQIADYGWAGENDINQFSVGYPTFIRDYNRIPGVEIATEHTMTTSTEKLWAVAAKRGWTNMSPDTTIGKRTIAGSDWQDGYTGWTFKDGASSNASQTISYGFWSGYTAFDVKWDYDPSTNLYARVNGGSAQTDLNNNEQVKVSNVIVMFVDETGPINEEKHMLYDVIGKGKAILFADGKAQEITWSKKTRESELEFLDSKGKAVELTRGKIWISVLAEGTPVNY